MLDTCWFACNPGVETVVSTCKELFDESEMFSGEIYSCKQSQLAAFRASGLPTTPEEAYRK